MSRDRNDKHPSKPPVRGGGDGADEAVEISIGGKDAKWDPGPLVTPGGKVDAAALERAIAASVGTTSTPAGDADEGEEAFDEAALTTPQAVAARTVRFKLLRDLDKRLDKYLCDRITFMSRSQLQKLIDEGGVKVNGRAPKSSTKLNSGDIVEVVVPPPPPTEIQPEDIPLEVLYEDEHLIVINKSPDIIVHPARSHNRGTMVNALAYHFRNRSTLGGSLSNVGTEFARPGVVHRLDRNTSGVIVFAKSEEAHWKLGHSFEHRRVDKRYLAVVQGWVEPEIDVIDLPIGPHPSREKGYREKYVVRHDELGKPSVTVCRVRERYGVGRDEDAQRQRDVVGGGATIARTPPALASGWASGTSHSVSPSLRLSVSSFSLVELELRTGRTHQIRVHLSHNGWPIVGDDMYGGKAYELTEDGVPHTITQQALHACSLSFTHPIRNERMTFTAPLRGELAKLVRDLRRRADAAGGVDRPVVPGATLDLEKAIVSR
jgi:23S rRNA pseudouridine1911/1915/1917 synthase